MDQAVGKWVLSSCGISFSQMRIAAREHRHDMPPLRATTRFQRYLLMHARLGVVVQPVIQIGLQPVDAVLERLAEPLSDVLRSR